MKKLIVVSDWVVDSLSRQEFKSVVEGFLREQNRVNLTSVYSSPSTIHAGFLTSQLVEIEERYGRPLETIIFVNVDPRLEGKGGQFLVVKLKTGLYICGPNSGYGFSFVKRKIDELFIYPGFDKGGQFRSRDLYARVCAHLMDEMEDELELEEISSTVIPNVTEDYVGHIDNFGNIKTTINLSRFKGKYEYGDMVKVRINEVVGELRFVKGLFAGEVGEPVIYPGSSGPKSDPYLEISVWTHFTEKKPVAGVNLFNHPFPGMKVEIIK